MTTFEKAIRAALNTAVGMYAFRHDLSADQAEAQFSQISVVPEGDKLYIVEFNDPPEKVSVQLSTFPEGTHGMSQVDIETGFFCQEWQIIEPAAAA